MHAGELYPALLVLMSVTISTYHLTVLFQELGIGIEPSKGPALQEVESGDAAGGS